MMLVKMMCQSSPTLLSIRYTISLRYMSPPPIDKMTNHNMCSRGGAEDSKQTTTPLMIGDTVPDFKLSSNEGKEHRLSDYRGAKILLCFYDYAHCPKCAYSVGKLMGHQKKLAWASKLKVITVFLTNKEILNDGLTHHNAPIPQLCEDNLYPFLALADPDGVAATSFRLGNTKSTILPSPRELFFKLRRNSGIGRNSNKFPPLPISNFMPAEFLIDENGTIIYYRLKRQMNILPWIIFKSFYCQVVMLVKEEEEGLLFQDYKCCSFFCSGERENKYDNNESFDEIV